MKNILITIPSLGSGGAEKSLISLLNLLPTERFNIDLMVVSEGGLFYDKIPPKITIISAPKNLKIALGSIHTMKNLTFHEKTKKLISNISTRFRSIYKLDVLQFTWKIWRNSIPIFSKHYDIAISYMNGITNYYVIDKINAKKKILWVHNDYKKLNANPTFDLRYFKKANKIVTISDLCVESLKETFPSLKDKFISIENISSKKIIDDMATKFYPAEYKSSENCLILLSIGRLVTQKGFDYAVRAGKVLKEKNIDFKWFIIGIGSLKDELSTYINENKLNNNFFLLGERSNPYPYIKNCSIFLQTSRYEGKSIVIDEAKILHKPIISTDYPTINDNIQNNITGIICQPTPKEIAESIVSLANDINQQRKLISNLENLYNGNEKEIEKYINLFNSI